jgi:hypothetical protein
MTPPAVPDDDDIDGFDDFPDTYLEDDDYDDFLSREFDRDGGLKPAPRVGWFIGLAIVLLLVLLVFLST